jgi:hypothetical protein
VIASKKKTVEQGGHPKGATDAAVKELQQNVELATYESVLVSKQSKKKIKATKGV